MKRSRPYAARSCEPSHIPTAAIELLEPRRQLAAAGSLDKSFSDDGIATIDWGSGVTVTESRATVVSDGKTVVAGDSSTNDIAIARFNLDGSLDTSFGGSQNGKEFIHVGDSDKACSAADLTVQTDGKIVIAGVHAMRVQRSPRKWQSSA